MKRRAEHFAEPWTFPSEAQRAKDAEESPCSDAKTLPELLMAGLSPSHLVLWMPCRRAELPEKPPETCWPGTGVRLIALSRVVGFSGAL